MSAWETEQDGQRPREGWAQGRRVEAGGWDSPASAKKRTCPKSSSAFSRIMKFHGSATFTLRVSTVYILLLSLKIGNSVP